MVKEISGSTKSKEEQVYVYREDMTRHKIEENWKFYIEDWTKDIYQKYQGCPWTFGMGPQRA